MRPHGHSKATLSGNRGQRAFLSNKKWLKYIKKNLKKIQLCSILTLNTSGFIACFIGPYVLL